MHAGDSARYRARPAPGDQRVSLTNLYCENETLGVLLVDQAAAGANRIGLDVRELATSRRARGLGPVIGACSSARGLGRRRHLSGPDRVYDEDCSPKAELVE